jgi:hypothetical protein
MALAGAHFTAGGLGGVTRKFPPWSNSGCWQRRTDALRTCWRSLPIALLIKDTPARANNTVTVYRVNAGFGRERGRLRQNCGALEPEDSGLSQIRRHASAYLVGLPAARQPDTTCEARRVLAPRGEVVRSPLRLSTPAQVAIAGEAGPFGITIYSLHPINEKVMILSIAAILTQIDKISYCVNEISAHLI